jgi:hypothetical protein
MPETNLYSPSNKQEMLDVAIRPLPTGLDGAVGRQWVMPYTFSARKPASAMADVGMPIGAGISTRGVPMEAIGQRGSMNVRSARFSAPPQRRWRQEAPASAPAEGAEAVADMAAVAPGQPAMPAEPVVAEVRRVSARLPPIGFKQRLRPYAANLHDRYGAGSIGHPDLEVHTQMPAFTGGRMGYGANVARPIVMDRGGSDATVPKPGERNVYVPMGLGRRMGMMYDNAASSVSGAVSWLTSWVK